MNVENVIPILNVSSMEETFAWFDKLGWTKQWDWGEPADFGAVGNGSSEIFICLNGLGCRETRPVTAYGWGGSCRRSPRSMRRTNWRCRTG